MDLNLLGVWHLTGYSYVETHVGSGDSPGPADIAHWLFAAPGAGRPEVEHRTGLELVIRQDSSYSERLLSGRIPMMWYDVDGVLVDSPEPTEGIVREIIDRDGVSLHPHGSPQVRSLDVLRYDDGDTQVSDIVRVDGDSLLRVISVVTDELYFNRVVQSPLRASRSWSAARGQRPFHAASPVMSSCSPGQPAPDIR